MPEYLFKLETVGEATRLTFEAHPGRAPIEREIDAVALQQIAERWSHARQKVASSGLDAGLTEALSTEFSALILGPKESYILRDALKRTRETASLAFQIEDARWLSLPFELLRFSAGASLGEEALALRETIAVERRVSPRDDRVFVPEDPVRILIVVSNPSHASAPYLPGIEQETRSIFSALQRFRGLSVQTRLSENATRESLLLEIEEFRPTVIHFAGHFIPTDRGFGYVVRDESGNGVSAVSADELREAALRAGALLCVLNGCRNSGTVGGIAELLATTGEISVIGHQFEINDDDSVYFAENLYAALAAGSKVADAVSLARRRLSTKWPAWLSPTFYAHVPQLRIARDSASRRKAGFRRIIGRRILAEEICRTVGLGKCPVVNLVGHPGIGKTVVAELVREATALRWGCEVLSYDFSRDPLREVRQAIEGCLGSESEDPAFRKLIVIDHADASEASRALVEEMFDHLLDMGIRALLISRETLTLADSVEIEVGPLTLASQAIEIEESTRLFLDHLRDEAPAREIEDINKICRLLHGHPGLIESVAAVGNFVSLPELREQLESSPELLREHVLTIPVHMLEGLPQELRQLLRVASWFSSDFSLQELSAVTGRKAEQTAVELVELAEARVIVPITVAGESRYQLLAPVRVALAGEEKPEATYERFVRLNLEAGEEIDRQFKAGRWQEATSQMLRRKADFVNVAQHLVEAQDDAGVLQAFRLFARSLFEAGEWQAFEQVALPALEASRRLGAHEDELKVVGLLGALRAFQRRYPECYELWERRAELAHDLGDWTTEADSLNDIGWQMYEVGDMRAEELILDGMRAAKRARSRINLATSYSMLAVIYAERGVKGEARQYIAKAMRRCRHVIGDDAILFSLLKTGRAAELVGDAVAALQMYGEAFKLSLSGHRYLHAVEASYRIANLAIVNSQMDLAELAAEAALRMSPGQRWAYLAEMERVAKVIRQRGAAEGKEPRDFSALSTNELQRLLLGRLQNFSSVS